MKIDPKELAKAINTVHPYVELPDDVALRIANDSIAQAGEKTNESKDNYAYRVCTIAQAKKQKHVDSVMGA